LDNFEEQNGLDPFEEFEEQGHLELQ